jgi:hypothetical protein
MSINLAAISKLLQPGLYSLTGQYKMLPMQWNGVFDTGAPSDKGQESSVETRLFGLAQLQNEGQGVNYDNNAGNRYSYNVVHFGVGLGFIMTRNALKDNLYKDQFRPNTDGLRISFQQTKEIFGANILNFATTANYNNVGGDLLALCSTAHLIDGGTVPNRPTVDVELSEAALEAADGTIGNFKNSAGLKVGIVARKLIVPRGLRFVADRILFSEKRVGTADNDENALRRLNLISDSYTYLDFLTSAKAWFLKTSAEKGLTYTEREPFETDMMTDFDTKSIKACGYERYSFWYRDWRGIYGTFPT